MSRSFSIEQNALDEKIACIAVIINRSLTLVVPERVGWFFLFIHKVEFAVVFVYWSVGNCNLNVKLAVNTGYFVDF